jgi:hypothetical protein
MKPKPHIFWKSIFSMVFVIFISLFLAQRAYKNKASFQRIDGVIISLENTHEHFEGKDTAKFRYLAIDKYPKPFQLFIGKAKGDFKPKFEHIDDLNIGELVTIYFDENNNTKNDPVNNLAYFIDRGQEPIFVKGNFEKYLAYGLMGFCVIFMLILLLLRRKGKIS